MPPDITGYQYDRASLSEERVYILPVVTAMLESETRKGKPGRLFDLGCGNGSVARALTERGFEVRGVDPSRQAIEIANNHYPQLDLQLGSSDDDLAGRFGSFPFVISLEVIEHVYNPRRFAACLYSLLEEEGTAILSTPYHGYWKNLALALSGYMDSHFTALWDHGHIKFWSIRTLTILLQEAGFQDVRFARVGRIPLLAKSMIAIARKPARAATKQVWPIEF